jgi:hypothetical protein
MARRFLAGLPPRDRTHPNEEAPFVSHIVSIKTEVRDPQAVAAACRRLGLPGPAHGTAKHFGGEAAGLLVWLPDWLYPLVVDTATGQVRYDNDGGAGAIPGTSTDFSRRTHARSRRSRPASVASSSAGSPWSTGPSS